MIGFHGTTELSLDVLPPMELLSFHGTLYRLQMCLMLPILGKSTSKLLTQGAGKFPWYIYKQNIIRYNCISSNHVLLGQMCLGRFGTLFISCLLYFLVKSGITSLFVKSEQDSVLRTPTWVHHEESHGLSPCSTGKFYREKDEKMMMKHHLFEEPQTNSSL